MSPRPEAQLPFDRNEWFSLARTRLRWGSTTRIDKLCGHTYCDLTQPRCCACIDTRAERTRYFRYVDGRGMVADAKRWHDYCPGCKVHHRSLWETATQENTDMGLGSRDAGDGVEEGVVCATCGHRGHALWDCPRESGMNTETTSSSETSGSETTLPPYLRLPIHSSSPQSPSRTMSSRPQHCLRPPSLEHNSRSRTNPPSTYQSTSPDPSLPSNRHPPFSTSPSQLPAHPSRRIDHEARRARIRDLFERSFGTMSDIANDPDYVSPIASLYGNAYARFQERERERRERQSMGTDDTNTQTTDIPQSMNSTVHDRYTEHLIRTQQLRLRSLRSELERTRSSGQSSGQSPPRLSPPRNGDTHSVLEALRRQLAEDDRQLLATPDPNLASQPPAHDPPEEPSQLPSLSGSWYENPLDSVPPPSPRRRVTPPRPKTPDPLSRDDLTISNECKVCFSQHCDILLLPCAHLALCEVSALSALSIPSLIQFPL